MNRRSRTILVCMYPETSGLIGTFKISRALMKRGHRVIYMVLPDLATFIAQQGFEVEIVFEEIFPLGSFPQVIIPNLNGSSPSTAPNGSSEVQSIRALAKYQNQRRRAVGYRHFIRGPLLTGDVQRIINKSGADLLLLDPLLSFMAVPALQSGAKVLYLSSALLQRANTSNPPSFSTYIPSDAISSRARVFWEWRKLIGKRQLRGFFNYLLFGERHELQLLRDHIRKLGLRIVFGEYGPRLELPEIIMMPREFDFPFWSPPQDIFHMSGTVDLERKEIAFDWSRIDSKRRLIVCSLGTYTHYPWLQQFCQNASDSMRGVSDSMLVLNIGNRFNAESFQRVPENVILANGIPQLAMLRKASVMITQGGIQTIRECMGFGVPVTCFPCQTDQPGTAARVVFHQLGERGDIRTANARTIAKLVETVSSEPLYRENVREMQDRFLDQRSFERGIELIETFS